MSGAPLFSIITPTYNHENYIAECIESVIAQTYPHWEMIVVDDGSTDGTAGIVGKYSEADPRIHLIRQKNIGIFRLAETYNKALSLSNGEFIAILEGDDFWYPDKLKLQYNILQNPDVLVCYGKSDIVTSVSKTILRQFPQFTEDTVWANDPTGSILDIILFEGNIPALTIVFKKQILDKIGGFKQGLLSVDTTTLMEVSLMGKFGVISETLGGYRIYSNQITKRYPSEIREAYYRYVKDFISKNSGNKNLKNFTRIKELDSHHKKSIAISYSRSGRYKLARKDYSGARKDYFTSIKKFRLGQLGWISRSLIGLVFSYLHLDMEKMIKKLGRTIFLEE